MLKPADDTALRVFTRPRPFSDIRADHLVPAGLSIAQIIDVIDMRRAVDLNAHVFIDDLWVERSRWPDTYPGCGQTVTIRVVPAGGGGGKDTLRIVAMLSVVALSIAAPYFAPVLWGGVAGSLGVLGTAAIGAGVMIAGSLAINALIPPSTQALEARERNQFYYITGTRNRANPYGAVQKIYGKHRVYPTLAAQPYTENYGSNSYLRMLFAVGAGEYALSVYKIGETALTSYSDYEIAAGDKDAISDIFPNTVSEQALSIEVTNAGGWETQTTEADTTEITLDVTFPSGLWQVNSSGEFTGLDCAVEAEYSVSGAGSWSAFSDSPQTKSGKIQERYSIGFRETGLAANAYDVRVRKTSSDTPAGSPVDFARDVYWTALRSINFSPPVVLDGVTLIALRIKATGQLNGVIDQFNCIAEAQVSTWSGSAWTAVQTTRNPAWAYCDVLRSAANINAVADAKINGDDFLAWAGWCATNGYTFDAVLDRKGTVFETLRNIASAGRASFHIVDNQYSVVYDQTQSVPRQHFSPRNSRNFKGRRVFGDMPHALKCRFLSEENNYLQEEVTVCDSGYYSSTPSAATWQATTAYSLDDYVTPTTPDGFYYRCTSAGTSGSGEPSWPAAVRGTVTDGGTAWICEDEAAVFETLDFFGIVNPDQITKMAWYHIAVARLRPDVYEIETDVEHIVCTRGDLVRLTHDVILQGLGQARIKSVTLDGGSDCTGLTMDDFITMAGGGSYGAQIRLADGSMVSAAVVTNAGEQTAIIFSPVIPAVDAPAVGDMIFFGETGIESLDCLITRIEPGPDLSAKLTLVDYAAGVYTADTGTIPEYDPTITLPPEINRVPPTPSIETVSLAVWPVTIVDVNNVSQPHAIVSFIVGSGGDIEAEFYQPQYRYADTESPPNYSEWISLPSISKESRNFDVAVENGMTYDFAIRAVSEFGATSPWDIYVDYVVDYTPTAPDDITGLALVQGGSTFTGEDVEITWMKSTDAWQVEKYRIGVYLTSGDVLLRTEYRDVDDNWYGYDMGRNLEDNGSTPEDALTFRVWAVSPYGVASTSAPALSVTAAAPAAPTGLALIAGGSTWNTPDCEISWNASGERLITRYRLEVYDTGPPPTLLRTEYLDVDQIQYGYTLDKNQEDNARLRLLL